MMCYSKANKFFYPIVSAIALLSLCGCSDGTRQSNEAYQIPVDWYQMNDGTVIPIFVRDGTFYSVCRGVEVPLSRSEDGLVWTQRPSSMTGTAFGQSQSDGTFFISIVDRQRENFEESFVSGTREPIQKIAPQFTIPNPVTKVPKSNKDFVGWYCPMWLPWSKIEITKEGENYFQTSYELRNPGQWVTTQKNNVIPLARSLGFLLYHDTTSLVYNTKLKRYELRLDESGIWRLPLVRVKPKQEILSEPIGIGIPSWH